MTTSTNNPSPSLSVWTSAQRRSTQMGKPGIRFAGQEMAVIVGASKASVVTIQMHVTFTSEYNKTVVSNTGIDTYHIRNN